MFYDDLRFFSKMVMFQLAPLKYQRVNIMLSIEMLAAIPHFSTYPQGFHHPQMFPTLGDPTGDERWLGSPPAQMELAHFVSE